MERIVLEVNDKVAKKWKSASQNMRKKVASYVSRLLENKEPVAEIAALRKGYGRPSEKEIVKKWKQNQKKAPAYRKFLDGAGKEAAANGLTPEKLGELMEWDKETMKNLFG